ncbi:hypothetical protein EYV94_27810 [Puteibacter caeruleilacunae]|nr:hypothetical protein EYV94_27810 [Puteibacter caeruleilacunae]
MTKILNIISTAVIVLFTTCSSDIPTNVDIVGIWKTKDGALIEFIKGGTFSTQNLSGNKFFPYEKAYKGKSFHEKGKWEIKKDQGRWIIILYFNKSKKLPKGYITDIIIAGSKGILENQPPWYLFVWEEEEGGPRYRFTKKE